jgi:tight adherence protein B
MFSDLDPIWVFYGAIAGLVLLSADMIYLLTFSAHSYRKNVNRRLSLMAQSNDRQAAMIELRRQRGIGGLDASLAVASRLKRLFIQSGISMRTPTAVFTLAVSGGAGAIAGFTAQGLTGLCVGLVTGLVVVPLGILRFLRNRRQRKFTDQFAEALDIIIRSLRAGHPVPAALRMVAREMPDPIGTEFGMAEDEITYGLDLNTAMRNMLERVGQEDLPLFVTSVAIQASSGGNLTEILENLTDVIRMRTKMRRKIRALSAEGRISAIILSSVPVLLFVIINWLSPSFYSANWDHPWMQWGLRGAAAWMGFGNLVMVRMVNFRF